MLRVALTVCARLGLVAIAACAGSPSRSSRPEAGGATVAAASLQPPELVRLRIGDGPASDPVPNPVFAKATLQIELPPAFAGRRIELVVDHRTAGGAAEWLRCRPRVPASGPLTLAGIASGSYTLRAALPDDAGTALRGEVEVEGPAIVNVTMLPAAEPAR